MISATSRGPLGQALSRLLQKDAKIKVFPVGYNSSNWSPFSRLKAKIYMDNGW